MATGQALFVPMLLLCSAVSLAPARADIVVSSDPSQNMSCSAGVCVPTASSAVLNVNDLETLLSSGNVKVTTTGSGVQANDIDIAAALGWSNASALALDAYDSISINSAVAVSGAGGVSLTTNDGGSGGEISFGSTGDVSFTNLSSALTINGSPFQLVGSISDLATAIANNPSGAYALAANYDASADGTYSQAPIQTVFTGTFEGLGNTISSLSIHDVTDDSFDGLFEEVGSNGTVRDIGLSDASVDGPRAYRIGALAAEIDSAAIVSGAWSTGEVSGATSKAK
ncbi:MAG: ZmpA/ZmpB/ZmpC family metallo-endopeptidase-related protein, partial [Vulcanimicrobiaceae bacterium]